MTKAYDTIRAGLEEALSHAKGKATCAIVHKIKAPEPDVAAIRAKSELSQAEFARSAHSPPFVEKRTTKWLKPVVS